MNAFSPQGIIVWLIIPMLFTWILTAVRSLSERGRPVFFDGPEKAVLVIMLFPYALGFVLLAVQPTAPGVFAPLGQLPILESFESGDGRALSGDERSWVIPWRRVVLSLFAVYAAIALAQMIRVVHALYRLHRVAARAEVISGDGDVHLTDDIPSPLAVFPGRVLLPRSLYNDLRTDEIAMIIRHERHHIARGDHLFFPWLAVLDSVFWGCPVMRRQTTRCRLAAELACDRAALGPDAASRRAYGALIVRIGNGDARESAHPVPSLFSATPKGVLAMRLTTLFNPAKNRTSKRHIFLAAVAVLTPFAGIQWASAQSSGEGSFTVMPMTEGRVTSRFGLRKHPFSDEHLHHHGIDIAAPIGTPIQAPGPGIVTRVEINHKGYGRLLDITHADGTVTRYAQLERFHVGIGDRVSAGQKIAEVGNSGRSTGPHLHLEVRVDGQPVDPETVLTFPSRRSSAAPR
ncbi:MAG: M23/M56 family metallopeptidase [Pseudomonadota bacterium]